MNKRSSLAQHKSGRLKKFRGFQKTFNFHGNSTKSKLKETEFSTRKHFSKSLASIWGKMFLEIKLHNFASNVSIAWQVECGYFNTLNFAKKKGRYTNHKSKRKEHMIKKKDIAFDLTAASRNRTKIQNLVKSKFPYSSVRKINIPSSAVCC